MVNFEGFNLNVPEPLVALSAGSWFKTDSEVILPLPGGATRLKAKDNEKLVLENFGIADAPLIDSGACLELDMAARLHNINNVRINCKWSDRYDQFHALSVEHRKKQASWLSRSVLDRLDRNIVGTDGSFVLHPEAVYKKLIDSMVERMSKHPSVARRMKKFDDVVPIESKSFCSEHPYGRVVVICECQRPVCRYVPVYKPNVPGCVCLSGSHGFEKPGTCKYDQRTLVFVPHKVALDGTCGTLTGFDKHFSVFSDSIEMFSRLTRYLFSVAPNVFLLREILGGPFNGYLQATVMLCFRLSMSDVVRVSNGIYTNGFSDDLPDFTVVGKQEFVSTLVGLKNQSHAINWMNDLVQDVKNSGFVIPVSAPVAPLNNININSVETIMTVAEVERSTNKAMKKVDKQWEDALGTTEITRQSIKNQIIVENADAVAMRNKIALAKHAPVVVVEYKPDTSAWVKQQHASNIAALDRNYMASDASIERRLQEVRKTAELVAKLPPPLEPNEYGKLHDAKKKKKKASWF